MQKEVIYCSTSKRNHIAFNIQKEVIYCSTSKRKAYSVQQAKENHIAFNKQKEVALIAFD